MCPHSRPGRLSWREDRGERQIKDRKALHGRPATTSARNFMPISELQPLCACNHLVGRNTATAANRVCCTNDTTATNVLSGLAARCLNRSAANAGIGVAQTRTTQTTHVPTVVQVAGREKFPLWPVVVMAHIKLARTGRCVTLARATTKKTAICSVKYV